MPGSENPRLRRQPSIAQRLVKSRARLAFHHDPRQRHLCSDGDAIARSALDGQDAAQLQYAFTHTKQSEGVDSRRRVVREPDTVVLNQEVTVPLIR